MAANYKDYSYIYEGGKRCREHRVIMTRYLGRPLLPHEIVHHINGDGHDNRIKNLSVATVGEHTSHHLKDTHRGYCLLCGKPQHAKNLCHTHYEYRRIHGEDNPNP